MSNPTINYNGVSMAVFCQIRVGRFRLYSAALPGEVKRIKELWLKGLLGAEKGPGAEYTVQPMQDQVLGEEAVDANKRVVAVFGFAAGNAFVPDADLQRKYLQKLTEIVQQT
jgi:hypothetical protein